MVGEKSIERTSDVEQQSLLRSLVLHLLPGVLILAFFLLAAPSLMKAGYPSFFALTLAVAFILIPFELGLLLYEGKRLNGRLSLKGIVLYRDPLPVRQYLLLVPPLLVWAGLCLFVVANPTDAFLIRTLFSWVPQWFFATSFVQNLGQYSHSALAVTGISAFVLGSILGPLVEELYFRGYLLPRTARLGNWAPVLNAVLFSLYHFFTPWENPARILGLLPLVYVAYRKKNIYVGIAVHLLLNILGGHGLLLLAFR